VFFPTLQPLTEEQSASWKKTPFLRDPLSFKRINYAWPRFLPCKVSTGHPTAMSSFSFLGASQTPLLGGSCPRFFSRDEVRHWPASRGEIKVTPCFLSTLEQIVGSGAFLAEIAAASRERASGLQLIHRKQLSSSRPPPMPIAQQEMMGSYPSTPPSRQHE